MGAQLGSSCSGGDGWCGGNPVAMPAVGSAVQANYDGEWFDGTVAEVHHADHTIDFLAADGSFITERLPLGVLRRPELLAVGTRVVVAWDDDGEYTGVIEAVDADAGTYDVLWDPVAGADAVPTRTPGVSVWSARAAGAASPHRSASPASTFSSPSWSLNSRRQAASPPRRPPSSASPPPRQRPPPAPIPASRLLTGDGGQPEIWVRGPTPADSPGSPRDAAPAADPRDPAHAAAA
eukprot:TRINITY_DN5041_c0_g1_i1.p1 TRINITY_DN5041_c0_g1~~TRINITY_DN5041_c0_g1_i1.p1  ORF type:complete len:261 (+),score=57.93 TRINITY_DN5041_c0_g1_i1:76-783(+)